MIFLLSASIKLDISEDLNKFYFHGNFANGYMQHYLGTHRQEYKSKIKEIGEQIHFPSLFRNGQNVTECQSSHLHFHFAVFSDRVWKVCLVLMHETSLDNISQAFPKWALGYILIYIKQKKES